jgi:molybdopterin converting factor subunit 1
VRVTVRLFARLRDIAGGAEVERPLAPATTAEQLWRELVSEFPELEAYTRIVSVARNLEYIPWSTPLADGDEIAFLPPVSGG